MAEVALSGRRFFAPEIVQTSATDCGPAALTSALVGHGIAADYARLREACQTSVDGTSIDTLEEIAVQLGLNAAQYIQQPEDVLRREAGNFPALLVTRLPEGGHHFIVAWRRVGDFVQIMDPGSGRSWLHVDALTRILHLHEQRIAADDFCEFAAQGPFSAVLRHRLRSLLGAAAESTFNAALEAGSWTDLASLDASARLLAALVKSGAVRSGEPARLAFSRLHACARAEAAAEINVIPPWSWSVRPASTSNSRELVWSGAVALRLLGRQEAAPSGSLLPELRVSVEATQRSPLRSVLAVLPPDRVRVAVLFTLSAVLSVFGVVIQALAVRALLGVDQIFLLSRQRLAGLLFYAGLMLVLVLSDLVFQSFLARTGRHLEVRLWAAILEKVPKLPERYFQSRLVTDMADRAQSVQHLRRIPAAAFRALRATLDLGVSVVALGLADVRCLPIAALGFAISLLLPWLFRAAATERDMRLRSHLVAVSRFLLDALLGAMPVRSHGAQQPLQREHEGLLVEWARASRSSLSLSVLLGGAQALGNTLFLVLLVFSYLRSHPQVGAGILVVLYWGGRVPLVGQELVALLREYPVLRNVAARLVEPLQTPEEPPSPGKPRAEPTERGPGLAVELREAAVTVSGKRIVQGLSLRIPSGAHVAIVGRSGAGKSTLLGLLMGWHRTDSGDILLDGRRFEPSELEWLRAQVAWVDPAVQLWNRSLLDNVRYGSVREPSASRLGRVIDDAQLIDVLERLPEGMQTVLGEGGRLLSGGEGQRVRYARALLRPTARLVLLDEPFRGLERKLRTTLLRRARALWSSATLLCVTHDISETEHFDRVIVMDAGRIVEDGSPARLRQEQGSLYSRLLDAERQTQDSLFKDRRWRRFNFENGRLVAPADRS